MKKHPFLFVTFLALIAQQSIAAPSDYLGIKLWSGTPISLELAEPVSSEGAEEGSFVLFTVKNNVVVNGQVLIASGATAEGRVGKRKWKCNAYCAEIEVIPETVTAVDGQRIYLNAVPRKVKADCCRRDGTAPAGTRVSATTRNHTTIYA